jgi:hypothetical protein
MWDRRIISTFSSALGRVSDANEQYAAVKATMERWRSTGFCFVVMGIRKWEKQDNRPAGPTGRYTDEGTGSFFRPYCGGGE